VDIALSPTLPSLDMLASGIRRHTALGSSMDLLIFGGDRSTSSDDVA
jgi:hypothetical protein